MSQGILTQKSKQEYHESCVMAEDMTSVIGSKSARNRFLAQNIRFDVSRVIIDFWRLQ